jgi:ferredoxin
MLVRCVHTANTLLQAGTQPVAIHLLTESVEFTTDETQPRPLIGGNQAKLSRRGLFSGLRQRAQALMYTGIVPIEGALVANRIPAQQRLPQNAPASRARLLAELSQLNLDPKCSLARSSLPFADVQVNRDRCSACGLCARFCPTAALQFSADKRLFALSFQTAHCIDCGICLQACPEDAIQLAETIPAVDLTMPAPNLLIDGSLTLCVDCGQPTAHRSDNTDPHRCYSCRQGTGLVRSLHDGAGLMADLLSRIPGSR